MSKFKKLTGAVLAAALAGVTMMGCVGADGEAEVRYTWRSTDQVDIESISASFIDVKYWKDNVYMKGDYVEEDATTLPLHSGSFEIPNNIFPALVGNQAANKGKYFPITPGLYTAVCSAEDEYGYVDIVANYEITINEGAFLEDGADKFFEVAFDVAEILDGVCDIGDAGCWGWKYYVTEDGTKKPMMSKRMVKKSSVSKSISKSSGSMNVEYYVLRRPKN